MLVSGRRIITQRQTIGKLFCSTVASEESVPSKGPSSPPFGTDAPDQSTGITRSQRINEIMNKPSFEHLRPKSFRPAFTPEMVAQDHPQDVLAWESDDWNRTHRLLVRPESIPRIAFYLKYAGFARFDRCPTVAGVDWISDMQRFEVIYCLASTQNACRLLLSCKVREGQPVKTLRWLYGAADWGERETWESLGVPFEYHPDLRKMMMDRTIEGFPYRKDFPISGFTEVSWSPTHHYLYTLSPPFLDSEFRDITEFDTDWELSFNETSNPIDQVQHLLFPSKDMDTPEMAALNTDAWAIASAGNFDNMGFVDSIALESFQSTVDTPDEDPDEHHPRIDDTAEY